MNVNGMVRTARKTGGEEGEGGIFRDKIEGRDIGDMDGFESHVRRKRERKRERFW